MKTLYLVMLSHSMDDIPLAIFEKVGDVPEDIAKAIKTPDCTTPTIISVVMFVDGVPASRDVIRSYDDEE